MGQNKKRPKMAAQATFPEKLQQPLISVDQPCAKTEETFFVFPAGVIKAFVCRVGAESLAFSLGYRIEVVNSAITGSKRPAQARPVLHVLLRRRLDLIDL